MDLLLELDKAVKRGPQPGQLGFAFDESEHPREPAGSAKGGEFKKKDGGETAEPRDMTTLSAGELKTIYRDANAWQYLRMRHDAGYPWADKAEHLNFARGTSKSHLDHWLMDRHNIDHQTARQVSNDLDGGRTWSMANNSSGKPTPAWHGGDPVPTYADYPNAVPERIGATDWAKGPDTSANVLHTFTNEEDGVKSVVARNTGAGGGFIVSLHDTDAGDVVGISKIHTTEEAAIKDAKELVHLPKDVEEGGGASSDDNSASGRSKPDTSEPLFDDTYTGPRFTYGGQNRPLGYAAIPKGHIIDSQREHPSFRHGVIDYPRELTPEETYGFELDRVFADSESGGMSPEQIMTAGAWIEDFKKELPSMSREDKDMLVGVYRAHKQGPAALRTFLDDNRATNYYADGLANQLDLPKASVKPEIKPADQPAWKMSASGYLSAHNVHEPWIAEIAPHQMGMMSERQKAKYHEKRAEEWGTAGQAKQEWRNAIMAAYDRGEITKDTEGLHPDAKPVIYNGLKAREEEAVKAKAAEIGRTNDIRSADQVNVGDRVWDRASMQYGLVTDKKRGRLFIQPEATTGYASKPFSAMFGRFQRLSSSDVEAAAKQEATKKSLVLTLTAEELAKAAHRPTVPSGQLGFSFDEGAHPRVAAGSHEGGHHGGEFSKKKEPALMLGKKQHGEPARTARSDVHRPAEMVPGDYEYLAASFPVDTEHGTHAQWEGDSEWKKLGEPHEGTAAHSQPGKCDHCGSHHKYQVLLRHKGTGDLVSVGHQCYENRFDVPGWQNVVADKARRAELAEKRHANVLKGRAEMTTEEADAHTWATGSDAHPIAQDMARKLAEFGPLSSKQKSFMVKLHNEHLEKQTAKEKEPEKFQPVPSGKHTVRGVVLSTRFVENDFGGQTKMLVQDERGFKVWGTRPAALGDADKGSLVEFTGTLEPSKDDESFGFFSRPSKARYTDQPEGSGPDAKEIQRISDAATTEYPGGEWSVGNIKAALKDFDGDVRLAMVSLLNHFGMGKEARRDYPDLASHGLSDKPTDSLPKSRAAVEKPAEPDYLWQQTRADVAGEFGNPKDTNRGDTVEGKKARIEARLKFHKETVADAVKQGKAVPDEVLADYPELTANSLAKAVDRDPMLLLKAKAQPGQLGFGFDEEKHPREPAGSAKGGEFAKKPEPEYKGGPVPSKQQDESSKPYILGVNDDVTTCEKCGKVNLKKTVVLGYHDGRDPVHYGSDCAAASLYGSKSSGNRAKVDLEAKAVEYALRRMKETGDPNQVANEIQGRIGYGKVGMKQGGLDVGNIHIREDGSVGEPLGPLMTYDLLTRIQNMWRSGRYTDEQIAEKRGATLSQVRSIARELKRTHEPLGGHMASHVPVGTSSPITEAPTPTEDFRMSKGMSLVLTLERPQPIASG